MRQSKIILQPFCIITFFLLTSLTLKAQLAFPEGSLVYRADTVKRLVVTPASYIVSQVIAYKKLDQLRVEIWRVNTNDKNDTKKEIHIRNRKGIYMFIDSSNFTTFMSYGEEKRRTQGRTNEYKVIKELKNMIWLNLSAQRVLVEGGAKNDKSEMVITKSINIPIGLVFDSLQCKMPGTPLQFIVKEKGWMTQLNAVKLEPMNIPDTFFDVDPRLKIISFERLDVNLSDFK